MTGCAEKAEETARAPARMLLDPGHFLALGGGTGLAPVAPGTFGTLAAVILYLPLSLLPITVYVAAVAAMFLAGLPLCERTAAALGEHDHGAIVWDEMVGYLIAVSCCSTGGYGLTVGFFTFRFFDIVKPWPAGAIDRRLGGGPGIMLDDVVAGLYALIGVEIFEYFSLSYKLFQ